jgi:RNA polymerase sigma factor (TIGR02999 family)
MLRGNFYAILLASRVSKLENGGMSPPRRNRCRIPAMNDARPLTDLIRRAQSGDAAALRAVFDAAYQELRALARARLRRSGPDSLLDTTSLVHESFLRFADAGRLRVEDRRHFFGYAAQVMRSVVVDLVRQRQSERRGGLAQRVTLATDAGEALPGGEDEILRVHEVLEELARLDARMAQVVEMRYFAGMTQAEISDVLGVTERTVRRDWEKARLLLAEALR